MHVGFLVTLAVSVASWGGLNTSLHATPMADKGSIVQMTRSVAVSDSIEITNNHPHPMAVAVIGDKTETQLGIVPGGKTMKFEVVIPPGAKELRLRAGNPADMSNMAMDGVVAIVPGKALAWIISLDGSE